jgi:hypothetical protein
MECSYCKKQYASIYSLKKHQQTTKSCLALQRVDKTTFTCSFCSKELSSKIRLDYHITICKEKVKQELNKIQHIKQEAEDKIEDISFQLRNQKEELEYESALEKEKLKEELRKKDEKIKELEEQLKSRGTITNNTTIDTFNNNINITIYETMTPDRVEEYFKKNYKLDTLLGGQKELARFLCDEFIKKHKAVYQCADRSRHKFIMNKDGKMVEDTNCDNIIGLASIGFPHVKNVYDDAMFSRLPEDISEDDVQENYRSISSISKDRSQFKNELSKIVPHTVENESGNNLDFLNKQCKFMLENMYTTESKDNQHSDEFQEPIKKPDIGGVSRGKLMIYRERYKKDGTIKGPLSIMEQLEVNKKVKDEYMNFLMSHD